MFNMIILKLIITSLTLSEKKISVGETITYTASPVSNENHQVRDEQDGDDHSKNGRSRKRKRQPENWKQNIRKRKRQTGSEYIGYTSETRHKREMKLKSKGL